MRCPTREGNKSHNHELKADKRLRACLHEGGGTQVGEVTCGGLPHLKCKRDHIKMRHYMDRRVTPSKRVTSPIWGTPPPCKQALIFTLAMIPQGMQKYIDEKCLYCSSFFCFLTLHAGTGGIHKFLGFLILLVFQSRISS